jgi:hypothetical protein
MAKNITVTAGSCNDLAQLINKNVASGEVTPDVECDACINRKKCKFVKSQWKDAEEINMDLKPEEQCQYAVGMAEGYGIKKPIRAHTYLQTNAIGDESMVINFLLGGTIKESIYDDVMVKLKDRSM